ncbi:hypothetical protein ACOMHN_060023 [Nucella lapillus]
MDDATDKHTSLIPETPNPKSTKPLEKKKHVNKMKKQAGKEAEEEEEDDRQTQKVSLLERFPTEQRTGHLTPQKEVPTIHLPPKTTADSEKQTDNHLPDSTDQTAIHSTQKTQTFIQGSPRLESNPDSPLTATTTSSKASILKPRSRAQEESSYTSGVDSSTGSTVSKQPTARVTAGAESEAWRTVSGGRTPLGHGSRVRFVSSVETPEGSGWILPATPSTTTGASPGMAGGSQSDVSRAGDGRHVGEGGTTPYISRKHKLLARRKGISDLPSQAVAASDDPGDQDVGAKLEFRLRALDYMVNRSYRQEVQMARGELQPRRLHRTPAMHTRWQAASDLMALQELLVHLRSARHHKEQLRDRAVSTTPTAPDHSSPDARVTPEGQSSDEGADNWEPDTVTACRSHPRTEATSTTKDINPKARRGKLNQLPETSAVVGQTDVNTLTTTGQTHERSMKTYAAIGPKEDRSVKPSAMKTDAIVNSSQTQERNGGKKGLLKRTPPLSPEEGHTQESFKQLSQSLKAGEKVKPLPYLSGSGEKVKPLPYLSGSGEHVEEVRRELGLPPYDSGKGGDQRGVNISLWQATPCSHPCRRGNTHLRYHSASCVGHRSCASVDNVPVLKNAFIHIAKQRETQKRMKYFQKSAPKIIHYINTNWVNTTFHTHSSFLNGRNFHSKYLDPLPDPANKSTGSTPRSTQQSRPASSGTLPKVVLDFRQLETFRQVDVREHPPPNWEHESKSLLPLAPIPASSTVPAPSFGEAEETQELQLEYSETVTNPGAPSETYTGETHSTGPEPKTNVVNGSHKPDARNLSELKAPRDPVLRQLLARNPSLSDRMKERIWDMMRIYAPARIRKAPR